MTDERAAISVEEAGRRLGIGRNLAYEAVRQGRIPSLRIGGRILVPLRGLDELLASAKSNGHHDD